MSRTADLLDSRCDLRRSCDIVEPLDKFLKCESGFISTIVRVGIYVGCFISGFGERSEQEV
jgi:hypothetical protein